jgi:hypothetical protein
MKEKINKDIQITKLEAALRQLETAIVLWFHNCDSLSIHTLASSAYQIIYDLNKHQQGPPMTPDSDYIKPEDQEKVRRALKKWSNFLKHADNDPTKTIFFNSLSNDYLLFDAVISYSIVAKETKPILRCFYIWFLICHKKLIPNNQFKLLEKTIPFYKGMNRVEFFNEALPIIARGLVTI